MSNIHDPDFWKLTPPPIDEVESSQLDAVRSAVMSAYRVSSVDLGTISYTNRTSEVDWKYFSQFWQAPNVTHSVTEKIDDAGQTVYEENVICPHCKIRIVAGRQLHVWPIEGDEQVSNPRDTQFAGFAKLLVEELLKDAPAEPPAGLKGQLVADWQEKIVRRAYDFALHVLEHAPITEWDPIVADIPDIIKWPEERI